MLLALFTTLRLAITGTASYLGLLNKNYYSQPQRQDEAKHLLQISDDDMQKSFNYAKDCFDFGQISSWFMEIVLLAFIIFGGLGLMENIAKVASATLVEGGSEFTTGLVFFAILGLLSFIISTPFDYYATFRLEERYGFNRQTRGGFFLDKLKMLLLGTVMGGILLSVLLLIMMKAGVYWWVYGWMFVFGFSLCAQWIYPTVLAPLFNKFQPVEDGELKDGIFAMANKAGFATSEIFVMDASKRSTHGNAYFTGVFGEKRIVLFDTLISSLKVKEVVAVLAHEIGHYKLHHIRWRLVQSFFITGVVFYLLSIFLGMNVFYEAFSLQSATSYGGLLVFFMWFNIIEFFLKPIESLISRKCEFSADRFAKKIVGDGEDLAHGLLNLRKENSSMPISHPLYSAIYFSHPPIIERLKALGHSSNNKG